jgi:outer membrane protein OmpA-like peptidoglycan-associated protein
MMWLGLTAMVAGCGSISPERERACLIGAGVGALAGGGLGAAGAAGPGHGTNKAYEIGVAAGVGGGALFGGVLGCLMGGPYEASPPPPQKIVLRGVHFNFDKSFIREVDKPVLDEAAETLKGNPNVKVDVNGYCDAIGGMKYNQKLSERRAASVAAYLEDKGIPADQLIPQGFGKTDFVATNKTAEGRAENRRVELAPLDQ